MITRLHNASKLLSRRYPRIESLTLTRSSAHGLRCRYRAFGDFPSSSDADSKDSGSGTVPKFSSANEWRKQQLEKIENKFKGKQQEPLTIESEEDLQPMWKEMEGRVTRRKLRTLAETGGKSGRMNIKKTDEDVWLKEGLYSATEENDLKKTK